MTLRLPVDWPLFLLLKNAEVKISDFICPGVDAVVLDQEQTQKALAWIRKPESRTQLLLDLASYGPFWPEERLLPRVYKITRDLESLYYKDLAAKSWALKRSK